MFEAAQASAQQYLDSVESLAQRKESEVDKRQCDDLVKRTQWRCVKMEQETKLRCAQMLERAKVESQSYWDEVLDKLDGYYNQRSPLRQMMTQLFFGKKT